MKKKSIISIILVISFLLTSCSKSTKEQINIINDNYRTYYEVFLYSFCDSNGDGIGDINGLISKLDYIEDMGFNGIWLMPINESTTYHKYDVVNYSTIDKEYGTLDDFKKLIKECDQRGIKLITDLVINHTSAQNEWFVNATNYLKTLNTNEEPSVKDNKYVEYYNFKRDKSGDNKWHNVEGTPWYYECVFWDQMPDLNLGNANVRKEIESVVGFWLDLGVGGFRIDAAKEFYSGANDKNIEVLKWLNDYVKSKNKDSYMVAEVYDTFGTLSSYYKSGIDSVFNFGFAEGGGKIATTVNKATRGKAGISFVNAMKNSQDILFEMNENAIDASFLSNHDTARASGYVAYDEKLVKLQQGLNLMMNGSTFIYYGEEIGMTGSGRDENKRAPMLWSNKEDKEITHGPKDMETVEYKFQSVEEQQKDKNSILNYVKKGILLRNQYPEISRGSIEVVEENKDKDIGIIKKTYQQSTITMFYNLCPDEKVVSLKDLNIEVSKVKGYLTVNSSEKVTMKGNQVTLPAYAIAILK